MVKVPVIDSQGSESHGKSGVSAYLPIGSPASGRGAVDHQQTENFRYRGPRGGQRLRRGGRAAGGRRFRGSLWRAAVDDNNTIQGNRITGNQACSLAYGHDGSAVELFDRSGNEATGNTASNDNVCTELGSYSGHIAPGNRCSTRTALRRRRRQHLHRQLQPVIGPPGLRRAALRALRPTGAGGRA